MIEALNQAIQNLIDVNNVTLNKKICKNINCRGIVISKYRSAIFCSECAEYFKYNINEYFKLKRELNKLKANTSNAITF